MYKGYIDSNRADVKDLRVGEISLTSTWYNTIYVGANQLFTTDVASKELTDKSTAIATVGTIGCFLDGTASQMAGFNFILPKDYKEGTDILPYVNYCTTTTTDASNTIMLGLAYNAVNAVPTTTIVGHTNEVIEVNGSTTVLSVNTTYFTAITGTDFVAGTQIKGAVFRNATASTDTAGGDLVVYGVGFIYELDGMGSTYNTELEK